MDLPTILASVDAKRYAAPQAFLADVARIVQVCVLSWLLASAHVAASVVQRAVSRLRTSPLALKGC